MIATRRSFVASLLMAADKKIPTVSGAVAARELGITLIHEHVLVDFVGADRVSPTRYDAEEVFRTALPKLKELKRQGCRTLVECTPAYLGRDPVLLRRLAKSSGVQILTNTGYYGAANDKFVPQHAWAEPAEKIAERWTLEASRGIDSTGIAPAFLKIGVDAGPLSNIDAKLIEAAALCHRSTGLKLHVHTGNGIAARSIVELLGKKNVNPDAFVWVHAQNEKDLAVHEELGRAGVWLEWDGINVKSAERHLVAVMELAGKALLKRLLVSQDSGWYRVGEAGGGEFNGYTYLFTHFLPELKKRGCSKAQVNQLVVGNPAAVLGG